LPFQIGDGNGLGVLLDLVDLGGGQWDDRELVAGFDLEHGVVLGRRRGEAEPEQGCQRCEPQHDVPPGSRAMTRGSELVSRTGPAIASATCRPGAKCLYIGSLAASCGLREKAAYIAGNTNSVISVLVMTPPMTTVASGRCTSEPAPLLVAIGMKPTLATSAVIITVRKEPTHVALIAVSPLPDPAPRSAETMIMLLSTETPDSVMKPTAAEMDSGISRSHRATTPPTQAAGTLAKTNTVSITVRYVRNKSPTMSSMASG